MLTKNLLFGLNIVSLAGFAVMGVALTLSRQRKIGTPISFFLMSLGTVMLFLGLYIRTP